MPDSASSFGAEGKSVALEPEAYLESLLAGKGPNDLDTILRDIKTYHPDHFEYSPEKQEAVKRISQHLLGQLKNLRLGEEHVPEELKGPWPEFRSILSAAKTRDEGIERLRALLATLRESQDGPNSEAASTPQTPGIVVRMSNWDKFVSLRLFLDVVIGDAARAKEMGVERDITDPNFGFFIPEALLANDVTRKWHDEKKNFQTFAMLPGSDVLLAMKGQGVKTSIFVLRRDSDGKYALTDTIPFKLLYATEGGIPMVRNQLTNTAGVLDPRTGEFNPDYQPDFARTGRIIVPGSKYLTEGEFEKKLLGTGNIEIKNWLAEKNKNKK